MMQTTGSVPLALQNHLDKKELSGCLPSGAPQEGIKIKSL